MQTARTSRTMLNSSDRCACSRYFAMMKSRVSQSALRSRARPGGSRLLVCGAVGAVFGGKHLWLQAFLGPLRVRGLSMSCLVSCLQASYPVAFRACHIFSSSHSHSLYNQFQVTRKGVPLWRIPDIGWNMAGDFSLSSREEMEQVQCLAKKYYVTGCRTAGSVEKWKKAGKPEAACTLSDSLENGWILDKNGVRVTIADWRNVLGASTPHPENSGFIGLKSFD